MWLYVITILIGYWTLKWFLERLKVGNYGEKYVLVTGCDSGFGHLLAKRLDGLGFHVIAACLKQDAAAELKKKSSERLQTLQLNVTSEDDIKTALTKVKSILPPNKGLWAVVNNAGVGGGFGTVECLNRKDYTDIMDVNLFGVIDVTKTFLPLVRKERGRIVNMASVSGRLSVTFTPYCIAKYGVEAFSDSLRREIYHQGIKVSILEPGCFKTNILNPTMIKDIYHRTFQQADADCQQYYGEEFIKECINNLIRSSSSPGDINMVIDAYEHAITARYPKYRYIVGNDANYIHRFLWTVPEWLSDFILCYNAPRPAGIK
ncbi:retinol dehydrogenase 7 [Patella vulgata]|uniref:retinol dehydrogenase 7 n=1 Tax=Patella vulgata TaxID=6465 RepID=UPI00218093B8|nr:retinol dehydrogenase 7 [Patella vulgata]XP_050388749.1 retinol dehydrogenase 7 [Patella vulgata]